MKMVVISIVSTILLVFALIFSVFDAAKADLEKEAMETKIEELQQREHDCKSKDEQIKYLEAELWENKKETKFLLEVVGDMCQWPSY